ncbi:hypothetical protein Achl_3979 (plasmid) [Pseudarthrobacter chlorophenolicus A6]|uniref:Uncharacterized protein n=1 Tax=Pseudarthrobacter chlorophenolicus (strain ATCC 700700 / DSM 12829 / CIP 107037 / JCM 12360 / KCTC 9906 / NCIMB 13794 / A6) TaxID=452863 RepID=B8HHN3_PSECP|nr:hypothetical protein Achl_3979 [Pseudarthrobacter chlorophenolicus A6]SDQ18841.1 hypothetical protein SAMN04489738_0590 [Pseudarthrobacter chlorophenolicus]
MDAGVETGRAADNHGGTAVMHDDRSSGYRVIA